MKHDPSKPPLMFISHRHDDKAIADQLRLWVEQWTAGHVNVFQSSSFAHGPRIGKTLSSEVLDNLWRADVLVLIYTLPDQDWSYCMYECGVATDPRSPDTRVVVLQFSDDAPAPFEDQVRVKVRSRESVNQLVNQFLTDGSFFPGARGPITGYQSGSAQGHSAGQALFEALEKVPATRLEKIDEWPAWPFIRFQISLDVVEEVKTAPLSLATGTILQRAEIVSSDWVVCSVFGVPKISSHASLASLVALWKGHFPSGDAAWVDSLVSQIHLAAQWQFTKVDWKFLRGQRSKEREWFSPVVMRVRKIPYRNCMEFDVYFLPFLQQEGDELIRLALPREGAHDA